MEGLCEEPVSELGDCLKKIERSLEKRQVSATGLNSQSSRSHTIVQFNLKLCYRTSKHLRSHPSTKTGSQPTSSVHKSFSTASISPSFADSTLEYKNCQLLIIDLAGSERMKRTDAAGTAMLEATKINSSLMVLGKCLEKLSKGETYIPFRETKLTKILSGSFLTDTNMSMITNINPRTDDVDESLRV